MLIARGTVTLGASAASNTVALARDVFVALSKRIGGLVFDSRFLPESLGVPRSSSFFVLLEGSFRFSRPREPARDERFVGPVALAFADDPPDLDVAERVVRRAEGMRYVGIEIHVQNEPGRTPARDPRPLQLSDLAWGHARDMAAHAEHDDSFRAATTSLLDTLVDEGVIGRERFTYDADPRFERLWQAVRPMIERMYTSPTLAEMGNEAGLSERQLERDIEAFLDAVPELGDSWRAVTRRFRLRLALLLLSAPDASVAEVASRVGYSNSTAMRKAFLEAGIGLPTEVRKALLGEA